MKQKGDATKRELEPETPAADIPSNWKTLTIDWKAYEHYLEGSGLTDRQKQEFLEALWIIIVGFVDLGFDIHPLQQSGGQKLQFDRLLAADLADVISSDNALPTKTNDGLPAPQEKEKQS